jgi:hypothetical protein
LCGGTEENHEEDSARLVFQPSGTVAPTWSKDKFIFIFSVWYEALSTFLHQNTDKMM